MTNSLKAITKLPLQLIGGLSKGEFLLLTSLVRIYNLETQWKVGFSILGHMGSKEKKLNFESLPTFVVGFFMFSWTIAFVIRALTQKVFNRGSLGGFT